MNDYSFDWWQSVITIHIKNPKANCTVYVVMQEHGFYNKIQKVCFCKGLLEWNIHKSTYIFHYIKHNIESCKKLSFITILRNRKHNAKSHSLYTDFWYNRRN